MRGSRYHPGYGSYGLRSIGQSFVAFDVGGEADARFLFGPLELFVRVGFGGGGGYNFVYGNAGLGAAF